MRCNKNSLIGVTHKRHLSQARQTSVSNRANDNNKRIPFVSTFHPFSNIVQSTIRRHWGLLQKKARNLRDRLVKADVGSRSTISRQTFLQTQKQGTFPCLGCLQCNNVQKGSKVFHPHTGQVYLIKCPCGLAYVRETTQPIRDRVSEHKSTIRCKINHLPLPYHFHEKNHKIFATEVPESLDITTFTTLGTVYSLYVYVNETL
ncbi:unnamed protein product [Ranitomeya imitator]|uniref:GIY-YIG homing endonuclease n=1 Tax=Ranitomeya imitator TaxID=111125 RepID=A0ABN9LDH9_9NEOB|nr:unnamed protein product [Ranitomeya imitator]